MKHQTKWLVLLTVFLLALGLFAVAQADNFEVKDGIAIKYAGTATTVTKEMFENEGITVIGAGCFKDSGIKKVTIPKTVKSIQSGAFSGCRQLVSVSLPSGLKVIPEYCFENCTLLERIEIPASATTIGKSAFINCISLKAVEGTRKVKTKASAVYYKPVPGTVTSVGETAFSNCPKLVISCFKGSAVETFAIANAIEYESIDPVVDKITPAEKEYVLIYDKSTANTLTIALTVEPAIASQTKKNWSTSDPDVAEVSQAGVVTPKAMGIVTITVASESKWDGTEAASASTTVVVLDSSKGWQELPKGSGTWYYCNSASAYATGWTQIGGKYYYFDKLGKMLTGWQEIPAKSGIWYYLNDKGMMLTGWQQIPANSGVWFYFREDGAMFTGWLSYGGNWFYLMPKTGVMVTGTQVIGGVTYRFYDNGALMSAGWHKESGKWYYLKADLTNFKGWLKDLGKWYYLSPSDGAMVTGWLNEGGKWYYLSPSGAMATGWIKDKENWYFLNSSGVMQTGWQKIKGSWYYMNSNGVMLTGWQQINGLWYYFTSNGVMVTGRQTINGVKYTFNKDGAWIN